MLIAFAKYILKTGKFAGTKEDEARGEKYEYDYGNFARKTHFSFILPFFLNIKNTNFVPSLELSIISLFLCILHREWDFLTGFVTNVFNHDIVIYYSIFFFVFLTLSFPVFCPGLDGVCR